MTRMRLAAFALLSSWIASATPTLALPPGELDLSFGGTGRVTTDFNGIEVVRAMLVQADGKIVVGGTRDIADNRDFALARYDADGSPDLTFGVDGRLTTGFGSDEDRLVEVLQQPDGKLIAAGSDGFRFLLARYLDNGDPDPTFGPSGNGKVSIACDNSCGVNAAALQSDGKIVVAGSLSGGTFPLVDFLLARFHSNGALDPSFGTGGIVTTDFPGGRQDVANALVVQPDGKLAVGGTTVSTPTEIDLALARYEPDGSLDASFGIGGLVVTDHNANDEMHGLALLADGTFIASAFTNDATLLHYLSDGTLDPAYGNGGLVSLPFGGFPTDVVVQSSGDLIVSVEGSGEAHITRVTSTGVVDTSFAMRGTLTPGLFSSFLDLGRVPLALDANDRLIVAGTLPNTTDFAVARYGARQVTRCATSPQPACKAPLGPRHSKLQLDRRHGTRKLQWRFGKGDATSLIDLGDPTAAEDYALCLYDESAGPPTLALEVLAPAGGLCDGSACWRAKGSSGFAYRDKQATPNGMTALALKRGDAGSAQLRADAKGANLALLPLPAPLPLRMQLQASTGSCWEAVFSAAGSTHPGYTEIFKGTSD